MPVLKEKIKICDRLEIFKNGALIDTIDDLITTAGLDWIISRLRGLSSAASHVAVGSGQTAPALADEALQSELARVPLSIPGGQQTGNVIVFEADFPAGVGTGTIYEVGLFTADTGGILIARNAKGPYKKDPADAITTRLTITISNAE
ncbi:hypothetical protein SIID45300_01739 [Candidatus Magnetaquicoccaceae bacterium FCR-1]|uniref:Phage tail fibre protein N-terminal domain-containing protein n=1 Tax=Candidatus Magnetaquiglobus chichijimensis TaxID=3141448 RepID=A0ABQ0C951_9PROT